MMDPTNRLVRESMELANMHSHDLDRLLDMYDAADPREQRAQFEAMVRVAVGAMAKLGMSDPDVLEEVAERRNRQ